MTTIKDNTIFEKTSFLEGSNSTFIEELYLKYINDPENVPQSWREFFDGLDEDQKIIQTEIQGPSWSPKKNNISKIINKVKISTEDNLIKKELLSNGADVDSRNNPLENTPLIYASFKGYYNIAKLLISNGADVNMMVNKKTALNAAASKGHLEIVDILIDNNADINPVSYKLGKSETPLDAALVNGFIEVSDFLRKHGAKTAEELKAEGK